MFSPNEIKKIKSTLSQTSLLPKNLHIIGHRGTGASNTFGHHLVHTLPENTLESFKQAILSGADGIEFDVFETKDGQLLVIHDDELWKNVYGIDRNGLELPEQETRNTFRVSQKNLSEILKLSVGPDGEKPPKLSEVLNLVQKANSIRTQLRKNPIIINVDIKNSDTAVKCFEFIEKSTKQKTTIDLDHVYFTSSREETLKSLWEKAASTDKKINIVPQVNAKHLLDNKNTVAEDAAKNYLEKLKNLPDKKRTAGIDCVLWDLSDPLLQLCKKEKWQLHVYAPIFNQFKDRKAFSFFIYHLSKMMPVFLKIDNVKEAISILHRHLKNGNGDIKASKDFFVDELSQWTSLNEKQNDQVNA